MTAPAHGHDDATENQKGRQIIRIKLWLVTFKEVCQLLQNSLQPGMAQAGELGIIQWNPLAKFGNKKKENAFS